MVNLKHVIRKLEKCKLENINFIRNVKCYYTNA